MSVSDKDINDYLNNLESFKFYIEHIIESIRNNEYDYDWVKKLSNLITEYYENLDNKNIINRKINEVNEVNDDIDNFNDIEFIDDVNNNSDSSNISYYGLYNTDNDENDDKPDQDTQSESSNNSSSDSDTENKVLFSSSNKKKLLKVNKKSQERLDNFKNNIFDLSKIFLYKKNGIYIKRTYDFVYNSNFY